MRNKKKKNLCFSYKTKEMVPNHWLQGQTHRIQNQTNVDIVDIYEKTNKPKIQMK